MNADTFRDIQKLESDLWEAADHLRANSKLTSSNYFMPVLGAIFLRHAANRFAAAGRQIEADGAAAGCRSTRCSRPTTSAAGRSAATPTVPQPIPGESAKYLMRRVLLFANGAPAVYQDDGSASYIMLADRGLRK